MLLIPVIKKQALLDLLTIARKNTRVENKISLKKVKKKNRIYSCAFSWMTIGVSALTYKFANFKPQIYLGELNKNRGDYAFLEELIGAKFILFCERDSHLLMNGYPDYASKVETTF